MSTSCGSCLSLLLVHFWETLEVKYPGKTWGETAGTGGVAQSAVHHQTLEEPGKVGILFASLQWVYQQRQIIIIFSSYFCMSSAIGKGLIVWDEIGFPGRLLMHCEIVVHGSLQHMCRHQHWSCAIYCGPWNKDLQDRIHMFYFFSKLSHFQYELFLTFE